MAEYCELGCCELLEGFDDSYAVCADCGNDEDHQHGEACTFCGSSGLPPTVIEERQQAAEMAEAAKRMIAQDQANPRNQMYFLRSDTETLVQTQEEYDYCMEHHVRLQMVTYNRALDLLAKADAAKRAQAKKKTARKLARRNRKMNARR